MASKKTTKKTKVVYRSIAKAPLTNEMVDWLIAHGRQENGTISFHDPLLVQCVEELQPTGWHVTEISGNKYKLVDLINDAFIITPEDVKVLNKNWIVIEEPATEENGK